MSFVPDKEEAQVNDALLKWKGQLLPFSPILIVGALGVSTGEAYGVIHRKNWPTGADEPSKKVIVETIYDGQYIHKASHQKHKIRQEAAPLLPHQECHPPPREEELCADWRCCADDQVHFWGSIDLPQIILAHM